MTAAAPEERRGLPDGILLLVVVYLAAFWTWSGVAKAIAPEAAYEFAARVFGGGLPAKAVVVVSVVLEVALGIAVVAGIVGRRAAIGVSLALLLLFSGILGVAKVQGGGALACGCYAFFATGAASVDSELWINGTHAVILGAVLAVHAYLVRRAAAPDA